MKGNYDFLIGAAGFVVGLIGVGYAIGSHRKLNDVCDRIGKSIDEVSSDIDIDLPEVIIDKAVEKALDKEAERAVKVAVYKVSRTIEDDIHRQIRSAVDSGYSNIKKSVTDKTAKDVSKINIRDLSDEIREKYNQELERVAKIYKSITDTFTNTRGTTLTIS